MSKRPFSKKSPVSQSVQAAFEHFIAVDRQSGCWVWTGPRFEKRGGYGCFTMRPANIRLKRAHRLAWELFRGPIPAGASVLHSCDNPPCVNPEHLFLGGPAANMADKVAKGRQNRGERHGRRKLTEAEAIIVRNDPRPYSQIAATFGVSMATISDVKRARSWRHLGPPLGRYRTG